MALLDTTVFVDLRGRGGKKKMAEAEEAVRQLLAAGESLFTSRVNVAELYVGVELSNDPTGEANAMAETLRWIAVLELTDTAAKEFGHIRGELQRRGKLVGDLDILIGAIALANNEPVVTGNPDHFRNMPGVTVISYGNS